MSAEVEPLRIGFSWGPGGRIEVALSPDGGRWERDAPAIPESTLEPLQSGEADAMQQAAVAQRVTEWLFGEDLGPALDGKLARARDIVFSYPRKGAEALLPLPFELATLGAGARDPLALAGKVRSLAHEVEGAGPSSNGEDWPFRLLLVRAAPAGRDAVPALQPIAAALRQAVQDPAMLQVTAITSEGGGSAVTFARLFEELQRVRPHALVFLGHGIVFEQRSYLEFEDADTGLRAIDAGKIRIQLQNLPAPMGVPLVILAGCSTAAAPVADAGPRPSSRGILGMAQDLVESSIGVGATIGMRSKIRGDVAEVFLRAFFVELLKGVDAGEMAAALKRARIELHRHNMTPFAPFSPMLVRSRGSPAVFEFLRRPPSARTVARDAKLHQRRRTLWSALAAARVLPGPPIAADTFSALLDEADGELTAAATKEQHRLVWPVRTAVTEPAEGGGAVVFVPVEAPSPITFRRLDLWVDLPPELSFKSARRGEGLATATRAYFSADEASRIGVILEGPSVEVHGGTLFTLGLEFRARAGTALEVLVSGVASDPAQSLLGESNVVTVGPATGGGSHGHLG